MMASSGVHRTTDGNAGSEGLVEAQGRSVTGIAVRDTTIAHGVLSDTGGVYTPSTVVEGNLNYGRENKIETNVFAMARDWQLHRSRIEDHTSFRFAKNIVWWNSSVPLMEGDWAKKLVKKTNVPASRLRTGSRAPPPASSKVGLGRP